MKTLLIVLLLTLSSCKKTEYSYFTIKMILVNNMVVIATYKLPSDAIFYIYGSRGSYELGYSTKCMGGMARCANTVKSAVIHFEITRVKQL